MKVLVAFASKHGSTQEIASTIAEELRNAKLDTVLLDVSEVKGLEGYGAVILGSAIYAGNWLPDAKGFAGRHREPLSRLPVWLFSSGPLGLEDPKPHDDPAKLITGMGDVPVRAHKVFVGKLDPTELGLGERLLVKVVGAPAGDFRDWGEIRGWAKQVAEELQGVPSIA